MNGSPSCATIRSCIGCMVFFIGKNMLQHDPRHRIIIAEIADQFLIMFDHDAFCDQVLTKHLDQIAAVAIFGGGPASPAIRPSPAMPQVVERPCIAHDIVEMLQGRIIRMMLVVGRSTTEKEKRQICRSRSEAEIRVLRTMAGKARVETAAIRKAPRCYPESEGPEEAV